jgi:regulator of RNase E activity RraA
MPEQIAVSPETLELLRQASTATIATQLFVRGIRNQFMVGLRPANPSHCRFVGEAVTLRYIPSREDIDKTEVYRNPEHPQRKVIEMIGPGQVLVMDARGDVRAGSAGGILVERMRQRGAEAYVTDGALRDSPEIDQMDFPVFYAAPAAPIGLTVHHAVDINVPIGCAGVPVYPGDILVGDEEGVVVIPRYLAAEIAGPAAEQEDIERFVMEKIQAGAALPGVYPPNEATMEEYRRGRETGR